MACSRGCGGQPCTQLLRWGPHSAAVLPAHLWLVVAGCTDLIAEAHKQGDSGRPRVALRRTPRNSWGLRRGAWGREDLPRCPHLIYALGDQGWRWNYAILLRYRPRSDQGLQSLKLRLGRGLRPDAPSTSTNDYYWTHGSLLRLG